jgi:MFS transporter, putative metabolite:H+ symporter
MDRKLSLSVVVAALGYFVDVFDLQVFNVVSKQSLASIGISDPALIAKYDYQLLLWQLAGLLIGGFLWGIIGDKYGRRRIMFGAILLYSLANIANAFVTDIPQYIVVRFFAGLGLAGELGGAVTLVSEIFSKEKRGYATMIIVTMGACGAIVAALISRTSFHIFSLENWQSVYILGGCLGLVLLLMRSMTMESHLFERADLSKTRGSLKLLFNDKLRVKKYLACIAIGLPNWYGLGILIKFSEQFASTNNVQGGTVAVGIAIMLLFSGLAIGDLLSGWLSQIFKTRKKIILWYFNLTVPLVLFFLYGKGLSIESFYVLCFLIGLSVGYWVLFVSMAAEQFGTNLRATVTTSVPGMVRGLVIPMTLAYKWLETFVGNVHSASIIGAVVFLLAYISLNFLSETFGKDLDYNES